MGSDYPGPAGSKRVLVNSIVLLDWRARIRKDGLPLWVEIREQISYLEMLDKTGH
jgi:hypothetical protein